MRKRVAWAVVGCGLLIFMSFSMTRAGLSDDTRGGLGAESGGGAAHSLGAVATPVGEADLLIKPVSQGPRERLDAPLKIRVATLQGDPVMGCAVALWTAEERSAAGITGDSGALQLHRNSSRPAWVVAELAGFARAVRPVAAEAEQVDVILHADAALKGRVWQASPQGMPVSGAQVLAWEDGLKLGPEHWDGEGLVGKRFWKCTTDAAGRFSLRGLDPVRRYTLVAVSAGAVSRLHESVEPEGDSENLVLETLYGALIRCVTPQGAAIEVDERLAATGPSISLPPGFAAKLVNSRRIELAGAGIPLTALRSETYNNALLLFRGTDTLARVGPVTYSVGIPGFEAASMEVILPPVRDGLVEHALVCTPSGHAIGNVTFSFKRHQVMETARSPWPVGRISFQPDDPNLAPAFTYTLGELPSGALVVRGVPAGQYRVTLALEGRLCSAVGRDEKGEVWVRVDSEDGARVLFDLSGAASVDLDVVRVDGAPYEGGLVLGVSSNGQRQGTVAFLGPPYHLPAVTHGTYGWEVESPFKTAVEISIVDGASAAPVRLHESAW